MIRELKATHSYPKVMLVLSVLTFIFGLLFGLIGELFLPFAAASLAVLFLFEKPKKRILSYLIPLTALVICTAVNGLYALVTLEWPLLALILSLCYRHSVSKAECSVYMTLTAAIFILLTLYLGGAKSVGSFIPNDVIAYYADVIDRFEQNAVFSLSSLHITAGDGDIVYPITAEAAKSYIKAVFNLSVAIIGIISFAISGIAIKLFQTLTLRYSKNGILKSFVNFLPSNAVAYSYVAVAVLSVFMGSETLVELAVINVCEILKVVFAYIGAKYVIAVGEFTQRKATAYVILAAALLAFSSLAVQILSYLGVWLVIGTNNTIRSQDND